MFVSRFVSWEKIQSLRFICDSMQLLLSFFFLFKIWPIYWQTHHMFV